MIKMQAAKTEQKNYRFTLIVAKRSIIDIQEHKLNKLADLGGLTGHLPEKIRETGITSYGKTQMT